MLEDSFTQQKKIAAEALQARIVSVKELVNNDLEMYEVVKDQATGEHYLHFAYIHVHVAGSGEQESFHQLLPLESDDVLGLVFGEQPFAYPEYWHRPFLRNGPEGFYIWFDPVGELEQQGDEAIAAALLDKLKKFKKSGSTDAGSIRHLLEELDDTRKHES